jgi:hypothetical protein
MDLEHSRPTLSATGRQPSRQPPRVSHLKRVHARAIIATALMLGGCASAPFVDGRREAGQVAPVGVSTPDRVAICYSIRGTTPRDVLELAKSECAKTGRTAQFDGQDEFRCALLTPTRAFFKCVGK